MSSNKIIELNKVAQVFISFCKLSMTTGNMTTGNMTKAPKTPQPPTNIMPYLSLLVSPTYAKAISVSLIKLY